MGEVTGDLKRLIKLQRQRPAFARTISWEFSNTEEGPKKGKHKKKTQSKSQTTKSEESREEECGAGHEDAIANEGEIVSREHRLSTIESVGDSGSSDESEYFSALEDEIEELDESFVTDDTFETLDSLGDSYPDAVEGIDDVAAAESHGCSQDTADQQSGRRRRPSKKQKRKRKREFRVTFINELMSLGNLFDVSDDIDLAITETTEDGSLCVNRQVPTLVQLCMSVTSRKTKSSDKVKLPVGMRTLVSGWNRKQSMLHKQLSWLQNQLLPICENDTNFKSLCYYHKTDVTGNHVFLYPTRSVWSAIPFPVYQRWNGDGAYSSGKAASFLLDVSLNGVRSAENVNNWEYSNYFTYECTRPLCIISALASAIDLMLPAFVQNRSLSGRNISEQELFSSGFKTMLGRVKLALKARFPKLVDELFDRAVPYVMWARGNVSMATEMFNDLITKEKRVRHKSMYLSEIARMNNEFNETDTAIKFYRLAANTSIGKPKCSTKDSEEVTEQTQILLASVHDNSVMSREKARQSSACWNGALNLPKQRLQTAVMAVESFLCYHAAHWTDSCWMEEALTKIRNVENTHQYLKYHASMILALQGKETESRIKYRESLNGSGHSPGHHLLTLLQRNKVRNAWQPLIDIVKNNRTPLKLLKVVWRRQLVAPKLTGERPGEGQMNSTDLNLHMNEDGFITGDINNILPPQRDISLHPYTGASIINHVPSLTAPFWTCDLDDTDYRNKPLFMPTRQVAFSRSGTTVYMVKPSAEACAQYHMDGFPQPFYIYWENSSGQTAKINVAKAIINACKEQCTIEIPTRDRSRWPEEKQKKCLEIIQMFFDNNLYFDTNDLERTYNMILNQDKKDKKKKNPPKRTKKWLLSGSWPVSVKFEGEPCVFGNTVTFEMKDNNSLKYSLFVNTSDKESFLNYKLVRVNGKMAEYSGLISLPEQGRFCAMYDKRNVSIYNEFGTNVETLREAMCQEGNTNPCVIGPNVYMLTKDRVSVWKHLIGVEEPEDEEERNIERTSNTSWALAGYWSLVPNVESKQIRKMKIVGHHEGEIGSLLLIHTSVGLCFMDPESLELLTICLEANSPPVYPFSEDGNVLLFTVDKVKIRAEKNYVIEDKHITKLALAIENNILVLSITAHQCIPSVKMAMCYCSQWINPPVYPFSEDGNVLLFTVDKVKIRAEKNYVIEDKHITKLALAIENNILVFEIETPMAQEEEVQRPTSQVKLVTCISLPGFALEACFVGKEVGLLVATSMYVKAVEYHRQNVFHFKLDGHCYGMLLCLGRGPRSFLPIYLSGDEDGGQPGWYVYMRDGHDGIISVRLHDKAL